MTKRRSPARHSSTRRSPRAGGPSRGLARALLSAAIALAVCGLMFVWTFLPGPHQGGPITLYLENGIGVHSLCQRLSQVGLIRQPWLFELYLRISGQGSHLVTGTHFMKSRMSPRELARCLTRAPTRPLMSLTIPEGFDQFKTASRLEALSICGAREFLSAAANPQLLRELSIVGPSVEGYIFPLTYALPIDSNPETLIAQWVSETRQRVDAIGKLHNQGLLRLREQRGWGEHELLTLASMIEKETHREDERRLIAGVFFNRLDDVDFRPRRMLQSDPTAYYGCLVSANQYAGCSGNPGHVVAAMLRDVQNPYNTYRHAGLPPGPIANPGEAAIAAVMDPEKTDYLFFVARNGKHVFSRTLVEHDSRTRAIE